MDFKAGLLLKNQRENKGLSLEQIYEITRVSPDILRSIEEGKNLPAPVILKSFIKIYAKALKMDEKPLLKELEKELKKKPTKPLPPEPPSPFPLSKKHFFISLILLGAYLFFFKKRSFEEAIQVKSKTSPERQGFQTSPSPEISNLLAPSESKIPSFFTQVKAGSFTQEVLLQSSLEEVMYFKLDNSKVVTQILEPKKWYGLKARGKIYIRIQKEVPLNLIHNGRWILKNSSQVLERVFE